MSEILEQHFDTTFVAPNGIARLRELILILAMHGKLVEQDQNYPPASELLKEIAAEKERASHEDTKTRREKEELSRIVVDCAYRMHVEIGPGLLESVYEVVLEKLLLEQGLKATRQQPIPIEVMGLSINEGFRADLIVEDLLLVELKSVEKLTPVHFKQILTYLRLLDLPLGLLINFGAAMFKEGCKRIVNGKQNFTSSRLRVNQNQEASHDQ